MLIEDKNINSKRGIVIAIVQCENDFGNIPNKNIFKQPFVMGNDGGLYYLVNDVSEDLEYFINTGKRPEKDRFTNKEYHVFPSEQEERMIESWTAKGMTVTYRRQQIELEYRITIVYMKVQKPKSDLSISITPWFVVAGRPYPVFTYAYAIWHYQRAERKSLEETARSVRKLFGVSEFHKSTVSRSLNSMGEYIDASLYEQPLAVETLKTPGYPSDSPAEMHQSYENITEYVPELLTAYPSLETLERDIGEKVKRFPEPIKRVGGISCALSGIPDEQFEIIIHSEPTNRKSGDRRKRPKRTCNRRAKPVQRSLKFVDYSQREEKRKTFITICCHLALDAAITCHRFLI